MGRKADHRSGKTGKQQMRANLMFMPLEPRLMFDGAAATTLADIHADTVPDAPPLVEPTRELADVETSRSSLSARVPPLPVEIRPADSTLNQGRKEVAFIDTSVADYQTLVDGIRPGVAIVQIDAEQNGLAQVARWAEINSDYDAIHLLTHGSEATLRLGSDTITNIHFTDTVTQSELATIGRALKSDGELLLYGCKIASGEAGQQFLTNLAALTGADVAASLDVTGGIAVHGNWNLEAATGDITTSSVITAAGQDAYQRELATGYTLADASTVGLSFVNLSTNVAMGDFDNDGIGDALVQPASTVAWTFYKGSATGSFSAVTGSGNPFMNITPSALGEQYVADFNGDGRPDVYINYGGSSGSTDSLVYLLLSNSNGYYTKKTFTEAGLVRTALSLNIAAGDFDNDGIADMLFQPASTAGWTFYKGSTSGIFSAVTGTGNPFRNVTPYVFGRQWVADFNGDGLVDVYSTYGSNQTAYVMFSGSNGYTLSTNTQAGLPTQGTSTNTAFGDFDQDGIADVLTQSAAGSTLKFFRGSTTNVFTEATGSNNPFNGMTFDLKRQYQNDFKGVGSVDIWSVAGSSTYSKVITANTPPPHVTSTFNNTTLGTTSAIDINVDRTVYGSTGLITIYNSNGTVFESYAGNDARVTITGTGSSTRIQLAHNTAFVAGQTYYVTMARDAFLDSATNAALRMRLGYDWKYGVPNSSMIRFTTTNPPPSVTLSVNNATIAEAAGISTVTATLSGTAATSTTVTIAATGTAMGSGTDYTLSSTSITIPAGQTTGTATITAVQDATDEVDETVIIDITAVSGGGGAAESGTQQQTVTILDDDPTPASGRWTSATTMNGTTATVGAATRWVPGDFDNDGDIDVLYQTGNSVGVGINLLVNNGSGTFSNIAAGSGGTFSSGIFNGVTINSVRVDGLYPADYDNDGDLDLVQTWAEPSASFKYFRNDGTSFTTLASLNGLVVTVGAATRWVPGDFDNDGDVDVLYQTSNTLGTGVNLLVNNGSGTFTNIAAGSGGAFTSGIFNGVTLESIRKEGLYPADYDNDGDLDLVQTWAEPSAAFKFFRNDGSFYTTLSSLNGTTVTVGAAARWRPGDFDSDGDIDVLYQTGNSLSVGINLLTNNGSGTFTNTAADATGAFTSGIFSGNTITTVRMTGLYPADYDNDGDLDMVQGWAEPSAYFKYFTQTGSPPRLTSSTPADNATNASTSANIVLNFSETVTTGTGVIQIRKSSDNALVESIVANGPRVTGSGTTSLTIDPTADLASGIGYYLTFAEGSIKDADNNIFSRLDPFRLEHNGIASPTFLNFTTAAPTGPTITSATYDAATGLLTVTGTNLTATTGSANDIVVNKLSISGQGGNSYTLTSGNVEISSATSFVVTLNSADKTALLAVLNKNGTSSMGGTSYNLAAADDWCAAVTAGESADLVNNGITLSGLPGVVGQAGQIDTTFGSLGYAQVTYANATVSGTHDGLYVYPSGTHAGKILTLTKGGANYDKVLVNRFNANGTADTTFGTNGQVAFTLYQATDIPASITVDSNNRIVVAGMGYLASTGDSNVAVARLTENGAIDTTFGSGGKVVMDLDPSSSGQVHHLTSVSVQDDNKIVVAGYAKYWNECLIMRFMENGNLDVNFDGDGKFWKNFYVPAGYTQADSNVQKYESFYGVQTSGDYIYAVGGDSTALRLVRLHKMTGTQDITFGTSGVFTATLGGNVAYSERPLIQSDGKIILVTTSKQGGSDQLSLTLMRVNTNGTVDTSFGTNGYTVQHINRPSDADYMPSAVLTSDGKIVVTTQGGIGHFQVQRYTGSGRLDGTFGTNGIKTIHFPHASLLSNSFTHVALTPSGDYIVQGYVRNGTVTVPALVKLFGSEQTGAMTYSFATTIQTINPIPREYVRDVIGVVIGTNGQSAPISASSFTFNTTGTTNVADISRMALYYTGGNDWFDTTTKVGDSVNNPSGSFTITAVQALTPEFNVFWLAAKTTAAATIDNNIDAQLTGLTVASAARTPTVTSPAGAKRIYNHLLPQLIWTDDYATGKIRSIATNGTSQQVLMNTAPLGLYQYGVAMDIVNDRLYFTQDDGRIRISNADGSGAHVIINSEIVRNGIAVHPTHLTTGRIFYATTLGTSHKIEIASLDGSSPSTLISNLANPVISMEIDITNNKLYWVEMDWSNGNGSLKRANLDGTGVTTLDTMSGTYPSGLGLDVNNNRVYYINGSEIKYMRLDGTGKSTLVDYANLSYYPMDLTIDPANGVLYWSDSYSATLYKTVIATPTTPTRISTSTLDAENNVTTSAGGSGIVYKPSSTAPVDPDQPSNTAPTLTTLSNQTGATEDTAYTITYTALAAAANEADAENNPISFRVEAVSSGTLTKNGSPVVAGTTLLASGESLVWTPAANANGTLEAFTVKAHDGQTASATAIAVNVAVSAVNDLPTSTNDSATTNEDTAITLAVTDFGTFADVEGSTLSKIQITTLPTVGSLTLNGSAVALNQEILAADILASLLAYTPAANASGTNYATIGFKVNDGTDYSASALTLTLNVTAVNDAPTATNDTLSVTEDQAKIIALTDFGTYSDVENNAIASVKITTLPTVGTLEYSNGTSWSAVTLNQIITVADINASRLRFTPATNANGNNYTTLGFQVSDGTAFSTTYTQTMNVSAVNDAVALTGAVVDSTWTEGTNTGVAYSGSSIYLFSSATLVDPDTTTSFTNATLTVSLPSYQTGELISLPATAGTVTYNSTTGQVGVSGTTVATLSGGYQANLVITFNSSATQSAIEAVMNKVTYTIYSNDNPTASTRVVTTTFSDAANGGSGGAMSTTMRGSLTLVATNDRPSLTATGATPTFTENGTGVALFSSATFGTVETGQNIEQLQLTVANIADGAAEMLVVDGTNISLTNGTTGTTPSNSYGYLVSVSGSTATVVFFKNTTPANWTTLLEGMKYRNSSDNPTTTSNRVVTLTSIRDSGRTANSGTDTTALNLSSTVTVAAVNDAPTGLGNLTLSAVAEDSVSPSGAALNTLTGLNFADADGTLGGVAVVGNSANAATEGVWQYSSNGGTDWFDIGTVGDDATALTLSASTLVRFVPVANYSGTPGGLTVRAIDNSHTGGFSSTAGSQTRVTVDTSTRGGAAAISNNTNTISTSITAANDAPTGLGNLTLAAVDENTSQPLGAAIGALTGINFQDVDSGASLRGVAVIGNTANSATEGVWQYSTDNRTNWHAIGAVGEGVTALALSSSTLVRFVPVANYNGTPPVLTVRALDNSYSGSFTSATATESRVTIDTTTRGGTTAIAVSSNTITTSVEAVNAAPVLTDTALVLGNVTEDPGTPAGAMGTLVSSLVVIDTNVTDSDSGAVTGIALTAHDANLTLYYSINNGTTWQVASNISSTNALLLRPEDRMALVPASNYNGSLATAITFRAWDQTSGTVGTQTDVSVNGGRSAFSSATDTASLTVVAVEDTPTLTGLDANTFTEAQVNGSPQLIDADVVLNAPDSTLGSITVTGLQPEDTVGIRNQGTGTGQIGFNSVTGVVTYQGTTIGSVPTGGAGSGMNGNGLTITLTGNPGYVAVDALLQNLTFSDLSNNPTTTRSLNIAVNLPGSGATFTQQTGANNPLSALTVGSYTAPVFVDIDNNGTLDLFVGDKTGAIRYFVNSGSTTVPSFAVGVSNPLNQVSGLVDFVDIDNDGDQDAFVAPPNTTTMTFYRNTGTASAPTFTPDANPLSVAPGGVYLAPTFVDIDHDGDFDAFVGSSTGVIYYFENTGTASSPTFTSRTGSANPLNAVSTGNLTYTTPTFVDVDLDGDQDFFFGYSLGYVHYYENTGSVSAPVFTSRTGAGNPLGSINYGSANYYTSPTFADINGDTRPEAVVGWNSGALNYYLNTSTSGGAISGSGAITITVTQSNDAPVLTPAAPVLTTLNEDQTGNAGQLVSSFLTGVADADTGAVEGIAIYNLSSGNGTWQYDTGSGWSAIGTVSTTQALLLRSTDSIRFVPDGNNATTASFDYHAWDRTSGSAGSKVDVTTRGETSAFSSANDTVSITVTAVNDAPTLDGSKVVNLSAISEDALNNSGQSVASLLQGASGHAISDVDQNALTGMAVTGSTVIGSGYWQYSSDNGSTWHALGAVTANAARLLQPADLVRYQPDLFTGGTASLTFRAWDQSSGTAHATADTTTNGTTTAFSSGNAATVQLTVNEVNDAPALGVSSGGITYTEAGAASAIDNVLTVTEDSGTIAGATIAISSGFTSGDSLNFSDQNGITGSFNSNTGLLTLSGSATTVQYQTALRSITFSSTNDDPTLVKTTRTLTWQVTDNEQTLSSTADRTLTITPTADAPTIASAPATWGYTEDDGARVVAANLTLADADDRELGSATVTLDPAATGFDASLEYLALTNTSAMTFLGGTAPVSATNFGTWTTWTASVQSINLTYTRATGVLALSGNADLSTYQGIVRMVNYVNGQDYPTAGDLTGENTRTLSWQVTDANSDGVGATASSMATTIITLVNADELPSVSGVGNTRSYSEGSTGVVLESGLSVSDPDSNNLLSATVKITAGLSAGDRLQANTLPAGISQSFDAQTGILTLTGNATSSDYQSALRTVAFSNTGDDPTVNNSSRTMIWQVVDSGGYTSRANETTVTTVNLTAQGDAPVLADLPTSSEVTMIENGTAVSVASELTVTDADDTRLTQASVALSGSGLNAAKEYLAMPTFTTTTGSMAANSDWTVANLNNTGIAASFTASTSTLTLSGTASLAAYQEVLRQIVYGNTDDDPTSGSPTRTLTWTITDANSDGVGAQTNTTTTSSITLHPASDVPTLASMPASTTGYTEGGSWVQLASGVVLADPDDANLASARVWISSGLTSGDMLAITASGITANYNGTTGVLTLTGSATKADYQAALRSVQFYSTSDDPTATTASRTISWQVTDANSDGTGAANSTVTDQTVLITASGDAPVITPGTAATFTEGNSATPINPALTVSDPDDTHITGGTVTLGSTVTGDVLAFASTYTSSQITGSYANGVFTLTGTATVAQYQEALRAVTFRNTGDEPNNNGAAQSRTMTWSLTDADSDETNPQTGTNTSTMNVVAVNDAPVVTAGATLSHTEGGVAAILDDTVTVSDADDTQISGATVTISSGYTTGDTLSFTATATITQASYTNGVLTLTGTDTLANYRAALRSVTFRNTGEDPTAISSSRGITWQVTDANSDQIGAANSTGVTSTINVTATADAPVISVTNTLNYNEGENPKAISDAMTLSDGDDIQMSGATITISSGLTAGDRLACTTTGNISSSYNASTGRLTLTGTDTLSNYQSVLRSVTFGSTVEDPTAGGAATSRTITWVVTDANSDGLGIQSSTSPTTVISVAAVNDAPTVTAGATLAYTENDGATVIDAGVIVDDVDSTRITGATVTISSGYTVGDLLAFTPQNGITGSFDASTRQLTLSCTTPSTLAAFQAALREVTFRSASDHPTTTSTTRTITWQVTDEASSGTNGNQTSSSVTSTVRITAVNDAPLLEDVALTMGTLSEDATAPVGAVGVLVSALTGGMTDPEGSATTGVAVISIGESSGSWYYSVDGGTNWNALESVSESNALLLSANANTRLYFRPNANWNGTDSSGLELRAWDGSAGSAGNKVDVSTNGGDTPYSSSTDAVAVTVTPVNDAPVNALDSATITVDEDGRCTFNAANTSRIAVNDEIDTNQSSATDLLSTTLQVLHGTLTVTSGSGATVTGDGSAGVTLSGTAAQINAALDGLVYAPIAQYNGSDTLTISTSDQGNTGSGGILSDQDTMTITVNAINDAPVLTIQDESIETNEDVNYTFSALNSALISVSDPNDNAQVGATDSLTVELAVQQGSLLVNPGSGATVTGDATASVTIAGTQAQLNLALGGLVYRPATHEHGSDTLTIAASDLGNSGSGGTLSHSGTINITIAARNDAPVNSLGSTTFTLEEDGSQTFDAAHQALLTVSDASDTGRGGTDALITELSASWGTLRVAEDSGATITGDGSKSVTIAGTAAQINAALNGLVYTLDANFHGTDTLVMNTRDSGNSGAGGELQDRDAITVTVNAVNDAPVHQVQSPTVAVNEDGTLIFNVDNNNRLQVGDQADTAREGTDRLSTVISVAHGTLTVASGSGAVVTSDGSASVTLVGTASQITAALSGLGYAPTAQYNGVDTLVIQTSDLGNSGSGGILSDRDEIAITVHAVNDAPANTLDSGSVTVVEDGSIRFHADNGNQIRVTDGTDTGQAGATDQLSTQLSVSLGTLTVAADSGAKVQGNNGATVTITGTAAQVNAALNGLLYRPVANLHGEDSLRIVTRDYGKTGTGGALSDTDSIAIEVVASNDAPLNRSQSEQLRVDEDGTLIFNSDNRTLLSVSDAADTDQEGSVDRVTTLIRVEHGTLTVAPGSDATVSGDGTASVTLTGTSVQVNAALSGMGYRPIADFNGTDTLTFETSDLGNSGPGGTLVTSDTFLITIAALNDAPVNTVPTAEVLVQEDAFLIFSLNLENAITVADVNDIGQSGSTDAISTTIAVNQGTLVVAAGSGATVTDDGSSRVTIAGTAAQINAALNGLRYTPTAQVYGTDTLTITTSDLGNSGDGGVMSDQDTVAIRIQSVNDAPVHVIERSTWTLDEDGQAIFQSTLGTQIAVSDALDTRQEGATDSVSTVVEVLHGTLTVTPDSGASVTANGSGRITLVGSTVQINSALEGLVYTPVSHYNGSDTLTITTSDLGNSGSGGALTDSDSVAITVNPVK
ncbi:MAG: DUF4347 domain-containing protein, partial [Magnetococcales bacterium]|nr:DUF4347 domain-containing protein [Magnetococcales bacterium]